MDTAGLHPCGAVGHFRKDEFENSALGADLIVGSRSPGYESAAVLRRYSELLFWEQLRAIGFVPARSTLFA